MIDTENKKTSLKDYTSDDIIKAIILCSKDICGNECPLYTTEGSYCTDITEEFLKHYNIIGQIKDLNDTNCCKSTFGCITLDENNDIEYSYDESDDIKYEQVFSSHDNTKNSIVGIGEPMRVQDKNTKEMFNIIVDWITMDKDEIVLGTPNSDTSYSNADYNFYTY